MNNLIFPIARIQKCVTNNIREVMPNVLRWCVVPKNMICIFNITLATIKALISHKIPTLLDFIIKRDFIMPKLSNKNQNLDGEGMIPNKIHGRVD